MAPSKIEGSPLFRISHFCLNKTGSLCARRVIAPGSVILLQLSKVEQQARSFHVLHRAQKQEDGVAPGLWFGDSVELCRRSESVQVS